LYWLWSACVWTCDAVSEAVPATRNPANHQHRPRTWKTQGPSVVTNVTLASSVPAARATKTTDSSTCSPGASGASSRHCSAGTTSEASLERTARTDSVRCGSSLRRRMRLSDGTAVTLRAL